MQKLMLVYRRPLRTPDTTALLALLASLPPERCSGITAHVASEDFPPELLAGGIFDTGIVLALALWVHGAEDFQSLAVPLAEIGDADGAWAVLESTPREYARIDWPEGSRSPGATLLALLRRPPHLDTEQFQALWEEHSALSLQLHPLTRYHRNAVARRLGGKGADWDGIVEERVGCVEDLLPERFYRGEGARERAVAHLASLVDLPAGGIRCALLEEYIIRTPVQLQPLRH